jgi:hypothetical protein
MDLTVNTPFESKDQIVVSYPTKLADKVSIIEITMAFSALKSKLAPSHPCKQYFNIPTVPYLCNNNFDRRFSLCK